MMMAPRGNRPKVLLPDLRVLPLYRHKPGRTQSRWADHIDVIARSPATKQSQPDGVVDCFAALAMTWGAGPSNDFAFALKPIPLALVRRPGYHCSGTVNREDLCSDGE